MITEVPYTCIFFFFIVLQILQKLSKSVNFLIAQVIFAIL